MRELVFMGIDNPRDIVHRVLRGADSELINAMGGFETIYRFLRETRSNFKNPKPFVFEDLKLCITLTNTCIGGPFYRLGLVIIIKLMKMIIL
jgi:hypothetical protein